MAVMCERCGKQVHRGVCAAPLVPQYPIRKTREWKIAVARARQELLRAWDNKEDIGVHVIKLAELMEMKE